MSPASAAWMAMQPQMRLQQVMMLGIWRFIVESREERCGAVLCLCLKYCFSFGHLGNDRHVASGELSHAYAWHGAGRQIDVDA